MKHLKLHRNLHLFALIALLSGIILYFSFTGARTYIFIRNGNRLAHRTTRYEQKSEGQLSILILGDSLAFGVGTSSPKASFAGQIGAKYSNAKIVNKARIGEDTASLSASINADIDNHYDLAFVIIGGNDIAHYGVDIEKSEHNLATIYDTLAKRVDKTYFYTPINFDRVSATPYLLSRFYSKRSHKLNRKAQQLSKEHKNVTYIDTFEFSKKEYGLLQAADGFHLNDQGVRALVRLTFPD